jgi:hypothetical protein
MQRRGLGRTADLIRLGGHLPKGGYDVRNGRDTQATASSDSRMNSNSMRCGSPANRAPHEAPSSRERRLGLLKVQPGRRHGRLVRSEVQP